MSTTDDHHKSMAELVSTILEHSEDEALTLIDQNKMLETLEAEVKRLSESKTPWSPDYDDLIYCNNVDDVKAIIKRALDEKKIIRIAGSQHSTPDAVFAKIDEQNIRVKLEQDLRKVKVIEENKTDGYIIVRVGAGCNLGIDPSDPQSNADNSFNRIVDKYGYALPILGGMSHQTIGGFMMTSTAGGSLEHCFANVVERIEFVDGTGTEQVLDHGSNEFYAAGVSMGLFGVLTYVTVKLNKNYLVDGVEETVYTKDSIISSPAIFENTLNMQEYVHCVWFPEQGVDRVLQFTGKNVLNDSPIKPYVHVLQNKLKNYAAAAVLYAVNELQHQGSAVSNKIAGFFLRQINQLARNTFTDHWYIALPNDDQALIDSVMRVQFTEIWIDVDRTKEVMAALEKLFKSDPLAAGNFGVELYGAKASPFWMSQSYGRNVIRVDPYWWEYNPTGNLQDFFTKYWNVLLTIPTARLHWGKHFPVVGTKFGNFTIGPDYVEKAFPKFNEWKAFRQQYDPNQIFLTKYWRSMFGISQLA